MSEDKKIKKTKKVKQSKTFSIKKLPAFYKKKKNLKKIEKKIFKGLHIANDESFVRSLYMQKDGSGDVNLEIRQKIETNHEDAGFLHVVTGPNM